MIKAIVLSRVLRKIRSHHVGVSCFDVFLLPHLIGDPHEEIVSAWDLSICSKIAHEISLEKVKAHSSNLDDYCAFLDEMLEMGGKVKAKEDEKDEKEEKGEKEEKE